MRLTEKDLIKRLKGEVEESTQTAVAKKYGISPTYVCSIFAGRLPLGEPIYKKMGFSKIVEFEKK